LLPGVVVQDELSSGVLVTVGQLVELQERFYAITTTHRHRMETLERPLARSNEGAIEPDRARREE
jgi:LysR family transcriptional regulator, transcriptional activator of nhaA